MRKKNLERSKSQKSYSKINQDFKIGLMDNSLK